jgi:Tol biopolymer transport system component
MKQITVLVIATVLIAGYGGVAAAKQCLFEAIAFTSTRDNPNLPPNILINAGEIYLMNPDGTNQRRLTENTDGDGFARPTWDGKKIVFDSNRLRAVGEPVNTSDLFVMNTDGTEQTFLTRGSSATWSPDSKSIAFHASASGTGLPIRPDAGAPTTDSQIFVMNVDDGSPTNITNSGRIDQDPDWSPDGQTIVFTSHDYKPNDPDKGAASAEMYLISADGTGNAQQLTFKGEEPRAPAWSPDGTRIAYVCRRGGSDYEICVLNLADGTDTQLTSNTVLDASPTWSPNGQQIVFQRNVAGPLSTQLFLMNADGTGVQTQLTLPPGINLFPAWGVVRAHCADGN